MSAVFVHIVITNDDGVGTNVYLRFSGLSTSGLQNLEIYNEPFKIVLLSVNFMQIGYSTFP